MYTITDVLHNHKAKFSTHPQIKQTNVRLTYRTLTNLSILLQIVFHNHKISFPKNSFHLQQIWFLTKQIYFVRNVM